MNEPMDVFDYNTQLVDSITAHGEIANVTNFYKNLPSNYVRVLYVTKLLTMHKIKPDVVLNVPKNELKAIDYRVIGNNSFKEKKFYNALKSYNMSLCLSPKNSTNLSICYSNRSAVYYQIRMYEPCLENIKLAKAAGATEDLLNKIIKRENNCLEAINNENNKINDDLCEVKLTYNAHANVPFIVDCLELKYDENTGRTVVTNKDLMPGDVIAFEEPYCVNVSSYEQYERCYYCLSENNLTLIPCPNCSSAMFCNEKCYQLAYDKYHKYDCPILNCLYQLFNKIHVIALKVVLTAIHDFLTIENLYNFFNEVAPEENNMNAFTFDYKNGQKSKEIYSIVHTLETNESKRTVSDLFQRSTITAFLLIYLKENLAVKLLFERDEYGEQFFTELLYRHIMTSATNMHTIDVIDGKPYNDDSPSGSGAYPFASLINHSCAPNILRIFNGTKLMIIVHRPIKAGEELMDSYGYHHCLQDKDQRQKALMLQYRFRCECPACIYDYPPVLQLKLIKEIPSIVTVDDRDTILNYDKKFSLEKFPIYCKYIYQYDKYYPCEQLSYVLESFRMCCNILFSKIPMKFILK